MKTEGSWNTSELVGQHCLANSGSQLHAFLPGTALPAIGWASIYLPLDNPRGRGGSLPVMAGRPASPGRDHPPPLLQKDGEGGPAPWLAGRSSQPWQRSMHHPSPLLGCLGKSTLVAAVHMRPPGTWHPIPILPRPNLHTTFNPWNPIPTYLVLQASGSGLRPMCQIPALPQSALHFTWAGLE